MRSKPTQQIDELINVMRISLELALPVNYRVADVLAFHGRDSEQVSERCVSMYSESQTQSGQALSSTLEKAILWDGFPACLSIQFGGQAVAAILDLDLPARQSIKSNQATQWRGGLQNIVVRMLGLNQDIAVFRKQYAHHPNIGELIQQRPSLRVPLSANPFEALCWAVTGQQISVSAAVSIRRRFIQQLGTLHSSGLRCHPSPSQVVACDIEELRTTGLSKSKAQTLILLAQAIDTGQLLLPKAAAKLMDHASAEVLRGQLLAIKGIGPWTVNYVLLRGFAYLDGSLHGDVAMRRSLQILLGQEVKVTERGAEQWLAQFSPWRALVAAHLWAMQADQVY